MAEPSSEQERPTSREGRTNPPCERDGTVDHTKPATTNKVSKQLQYIADLWTVLATPGEHLTPLSWQPQTTKRRRPPPPPQPDGHVRKRHRTSRERCLL